MIYQTSCWYLFKFLHSPVYSSAQSSVQLCTVQCTYSMYNPVYCIQWCTVQCTPGVQSKGTSHCAMHSPVYVQCTLVCLLYCPVYVQCTPVCVQCIVYNSMHTQCTPSVQSSVCQVQCILSVQSSVHPLYNLYTAVYVQCLCACLLHIHKIL